LPVYFISESGAEINHLLHSYVLREFAVFIAIDAVVIITATIGVRTFVIVGKRHSATLTEFMFHIIRIFVDPHSNRTGSIIGLLPQI